MATETLWARSPMPHCLCSPICASHARFLGCKKHPDKCVSTTKLLHKEKHLNRLTWGRSPQSPPLETNIRRVRAQRTRRGNDWAPSYITDLRKSFSECALISSMFPFGNDWYHYLLYSRCHISISAISDFRHSPLNLDYIYRIIHQSH